VENQWFTIKDNDLETRHTANIVNLKAWEKFLFGPEAGSCPDIVNH
jgi:hypothetical protein